MTVSTTTRKISSDGNGVTTAFTVNFQFFEIEVYLSGVLQTEGVDYTVSGGAGSTGTVTFTTPPPSGTGNVVIVGATSRAQSTNLSDNGPFPADVVEQMSDRLAMIAQEFDVQFGQALRVPISEVAISEISFSSNPNTVLTSNASGAPEFATLADNISSIAFPLTHENGGLEANVAAFNGTVRIASGATTALSTISKAEAEAGTATTVREWTALRVAEAIAALSPAAYNWTRRTAAYTASAKDAVLADTVATAAFTVTLPASPSDGDAILFAPASTWEANNLTIGRNGNTIMGESADLVADVDHAFGLVWDNTDSDWRLFNA